MLTPLYMAEISPPEVRGSLMALEQLSIVLGVVLGFWVGFWTRNGEIPFFGLLWIQPHAYCRVNCLMCASTQLRSVPSLALPSSPSPFSPV